MKRLVGFALWLTLGAATASAQDDARARELAELEAMLERVEAALDGLRPLVAPEVTLVQYDVRHLLYRPEDRAAPSLKLAADQDAGFRTGRGDVGAGVFSFDSCEACEEEHGRMDEERLVLAVESAVGGVEAWEDPRGLTLHRGFLLVRQTALNHARIRRLLDALSEDALRAVQLEVGFYALPLELEQEVRDAALASRGVLSGHVLARVDAAVRDGAARRVGSAMLTALDGQRVYLHQGSERAYVADYERSAGGTGVAEAVIVPDPIVEVLRAGMALEVRPTVLGGADGGAPTVALDIRFARSKPLLLTERMTPWGPLTTPQVTMDSVRTSARVPSGAGMLVFGARGVEDDDTTDVAIIVRPRLLGR